MVRALLDRDRDWAAYAIGDLAPPFAEHCHWYAPAGRDTALLLLFRAFDPPIVFAMGEVGDVAKLLREIDAPRISLHLRAELVPALAGVYEALAPHRMHRMVLRPGAFVSAATAAVRPIAERDLAAVGRLYQDGHDRGEGPTFFTPAMLQHGTFFGVWEGEELVSIAGTHLYSLALGVCAVGNVYTRADRRGRGLAASATSAVVALALAHGVPTIVLNVAADNPSACRVYERLGFVRYCDFVEGEAARVS